MGASKDEGIYLWGAGKYGIPLARYLEERDVVINGIVDNKSCGKEIDGFNIISFEKTTNQSKIFIAVIDEKAQVDIEHQILAIHPKTLIVKYSDFHEEDLEILIDRGK